MNKLKHTHLQGKLLGENGTNLIQQIHLLKEFMFTFTPMQPLEIELEVEMGLKLWADH